MILVVIMISVVGGVGNCGRRAHRVGIAAAILVAFMALIFVKPCYAQVALLHRSSSCCSRWRGRRLTEAAKA